MANSLGTGRVESHEERPIIHFGSPLGSTYYNGDGDVDVDSTPSEPEHDSDSDGWGVA